MKIRKYYARNLQEGMQLIRRELGSEAVIIDSRLVRQKGLRGWFKPRQLEILAALDNSPPREEAEAGSLRNQRVEEPLSQEVTELKSMVRQLISQSGSSSQGEDNHDLASWKEHLEAQDCCPELVNQIMEEIKTNLNGEVKLTREVLSMIVERKVAQHLQYAGEKNSRVQVLVGPTGVGKTTTLAKLAARYSIYHREKVGLITIDHFRIGAVEQLRTYSEIVDVPLEVVMTPQEFQEALKRLQHCSRILVDTAGRGTRNEMQIKELAGYLRDLKGAEVFLVLSATTRWRDIKYITANFAQLGYNRLIVTKVDETYSLGGILNGVYYSGVPLVYLTDGQNVPDDLQVAQEADIPTMVAGVRE